MALTFKEEYDETLDLYWKSNSNDEITKVASQFHEMSKRVDGGSLLPNTIYWEGECWFRTGAFARALMKFEEVLAYSGSYKEEAARYMVVKCYFRLKQHKEAIWEAKRFLKDYSESKYITTVEEILKTSEMK